MSDRKRPGDRRALEDEPRTAEWYTEGDFRTGCCPDCGTWIQGNSRVWEEHRQALHADGWKWRPWLESRSTSP